MSKEVRLRCARCFRYVFWDSVERAWKDKQGNKTCYGESHYPQAAHLVEQVP